MDSNIKKSERHPELEKMMDAMKIEMGKDLELMLKAYADQMQLKLNEMIDIDLGKGINEKRSKKIENKYIGDIWVFAEHFEGKLNPVSLELLGAANKLAAKLDIKTCAVLLGNKVDSMIETLFGCGADKVYVADEQVFRYFRNYPYTMAFCKLVKKYKPEILLIGATTTGRDLAGAVATRLRTGLTADCTELDIDIDKKLLLASRPAFGGNIMATIICEKKRPQMATVRPGVMQMPEYIPEKTGEIIKEKFEFDEKDMPTKILKIIKKSANAINIEDSKIIVCGGKGIRNEQGLELLNELAKVVGGVVAGSRGAVEKGLVDVNRQVGQTGHTVRPRIYFAIGISGAIQHTIGMNGSDIIVAINNDPKAPMMNIATYGIVGDLFEVLPKLIKSLKRKKCI